MADADFIVASLIISFGSTTLAVVLPLLTSILSIGLFLASTRIILKNSFLESIHISKYLILLAVVKVIIR
jgi:hypothetical protein